ncbi:MAG: PQQ-binding-like beta-propeller repeat protein [Pseudohongiellaceae bacterium]
MQLSIIKNAAVLLFAGGLATSASISVLAQQGATDGQWRTYGGDAGSTRYSSLDQINASNAAELEVAWMWKADSLLPGAQATSEVTPIMVDGVLYFSMDQRRYVIAADAGTGETLWIYRPDEGARFDAAPRKIHRGVSYWSDGANDDRIIFATPGFNLVALDAHTGRPVTSFGNNGIVDMLEALDLDFEGDMLGRLGNSSPVVISHDTILVGPAMGRLTKTNAKGDVLAFDVRTGEKKWAFHTIPRAGEFGYESWHNNSADYTGNAGVWGPFSVDTELGYVYLAVEAPTNDTYGGARPGDNLFSSSLVCVDIRTGERIWHFQQVHHDIWDYDNPGQPILLDIEVDGRTVKAVVQLTKQAFAYVYDRVTGEPLWPIIETPVPQTTVAGEWSAATQPIPSKPPAFDVQGMSEDILINFTPELRAAALVEIAGYTTGAMYTPPSVVSDTNKGTIVIPGFGGGGNWQGGGADPETGFVYVGSTTNPSIIGLAPNTPDLAKPNDPDFSDYRMTGAPTQLPNNLRLLKPPYGRITAYDMKQGSIAWQIANSDTPPGIQANLTAAGVTDTAPTGNPSQSGLLVTKTLLFAGEGSQGQPIFRAYNKLTGARVWEGAIPGGNQSGLPMTYSHAGRQYVVMAVNGNAPGQTGNAARLVAWALAVEKTDDTTAAAD